MVGGKLGGVLASTLSASFSNEALTTAACGTNTFSVLRNMFCSVSDGSVRVFRGFLEKVVSRLSTLLLSLFGLENLILNIVSG